MPWNSADKHADITLSNSDKTATRAATAATVRCVRSVRAHNAGKWYAEFALDNTNSDAVFSIFVGIATSEAGLSSYAGKDVFGWGFVVNNGGGFLNAYEDRDNPLSLASSASAAVQGDVVMVAADMEAGKVWFGTKGVWRYDGNSPNPATGTDAPLLFTPHLPMFLHLGMVYNPQAVTLQAVSADLTYTPPSGFSAWDDIPTVSGNVKDDTTSNASRIVRAYRRSDGLLMGEATSDGTTGNYSIGCSSTDPVDVVCLDDAGGVTYNTLVHAGVTPA